MRYKTIKTREFKARTIDGKTVVIYEYTKYFYAGNWDNPYEVVEGLKSYRTSDGNHVNNLGNNKYEIVETGQILVEYK